MSIFSIILFICIILLILGLISIIDYKIINPYKKVQLLKFTNELGETYYQVQWVRKALGLFYTKHSDYRFNNYEPAKYYYDNTNTPICYDENYYYHSRYFIEIKDKWYSIDIDNMEKIHEIIPQKQKKNNWTATYV